MDRGKEKQRAVVTGGAGFIGSHLVDALVELGYSVTIIDNMSAGRHERVNPKAILCEEDVRDEGALKKIIQKGDQVFHLAAIPSVPYSISHPKETNEINVGGTISLLGSAMAAGASRVVYSASSAVYGDNPSLPLNEELLPQPLSPYGVQKYTGEHYMRVYATLHALPTVSLRYFNVYGPRMDLTGPYAAVFGAFVRQKRQGLPMRINGDGEQTRDFVHVHDVVRANILAMESQRVGHGEVFNIGTGKSISINTLAEIIGGDIEYGQAVGDVRHSQADNSKVRTLLGWEPQIMIKEGIASLRHEWGV